MKKTKMIVIFLACCLILSGCVSKSEYDELEKRVEYLENKLNVQNENIDEGHEQPNNVSITGNDHNLDDMTQEEIAAELKNLLSNRPSENMTPEEYAASFKKKPFSYDFTENSSRGILSFVFFSDKDEVPQKSALKEFKIIGAKQKMDGSLELSENISMCLETVIIDYGTASFLYDALLDYLCPLYGDITDSRESTHWSSQGTFDTTDDLRKGVAGTIVELEKKQGYYCLKAFYRYCTADSSKMS